MLLLAVALATQAAQAQTDTLRLTLQECRARALESNENITKASNSVAQAEWQKKNAFSGYLPTVSGSATTVYTKDIEMGTTNVLMRGLWMAGLSVQQVIYAGGRVKNGNAMAAIGTDVAREQERMARQDAILEADQAFWGYVAVQHKVQMLESYVKYMQALDESVSKSVEAEMATEADRMRIGAKLSEMKYNLQKAQNGAELCRMALCNVVGADLATPIALTTGDMEAQEPQNLQGDVSALPEVQMLQLGVEAKEKQVKSTLGEYLPSLALMGGWNYMGNLKIEGVTEYEGQQVSYSQKESQSFWYVGLSLNVPISDWGKGSRSVKMAKKDRENAQLDLSRNTRMLTIRAHQAMQNLTSAHTMIETAQLGLKQAEENLRVMRERYDASYCTLTDLLDAHSQWQQAESNMIEALTQYKIYESEYRRAVGTLGNE